MGARLDYVFVRAPFGPVTVRRLADRFGSDHYPLLARLRF
jgi:endonuclease/exonuclease/phosphatase (EEP) superfamily protein YafD